MNILPKKSWHVRSKKNIERVRRDEENAALELLEKERRIALAESETRSERLRISARKRRQGPEDEGQGFATTEDLGIASILRDLAEGDRVPRANKVHEEEKRQEKEKHEKAIGLLSYLGQGSNELENRTPWYFEDPKKGRQRGNDELDLKKKKFEDPLEEMNKYLEATEKYEALKIGKTFKKKSNNKKIEESKPKSVKKTIDQLRMERLQRENAERMKQNRLMDKINNVVREEDKEPKKDKHQRYSSQYYDHITKF